MKHAVHTLVVGLALFTAISMAQASWLANFVIPLGPVAVNAFDILLALSVGALVYAVSLRTPTDRLTRQSCRAASHRHLSAVSARCRDSSGGGLVRRRSSRGVQGRPSSPCPDADTILLLRWTAVCQTGAFGLPRERCRLRTAPVRPLPLRVHWATRGVGERGVSPARPVGRLHPSVRAGWPWQDLFCSRDSSMHTAWASQACWASSS